MDLAVTKPSGKAICRKEEEREEPNDASKQEGRNRLSGPAGCHQDTAGFFMSFPNILGISWQG